MPGGHEIVQQNKVPYYSTTEQQAQAYIHQLSVENPDYIFAEYTLLNTWFYFIPVCSFDIPGYTADSCYLAKATRVLVNEAHNGFFNYHQTVKGLTSRYSF